MMTAGIGNVMDGHGNKLLILRDAYRHNISLTLKSDGRSRKLGYMQDGVYYKYETKDGIFLKLNAFGFCNDLIVHLNPLAICVYHEGKRYFISRERFDKHKQFLNWKNIGFELRCFVPLKFFKKGLL